jgi:hypothetical protein
MQAKSIKERLLALSMPEPNSGCWLWLGALCRDGYGQIRAPQHSAHRAAYVAFKGDIPEGLEIDHKCRVRCCVNPDHLEPVTHRQNVERADYTVNHRNGRKTHCKRGHPLASDNLVLEKWRGKIARKCRACMTARWAARDRRSHAGRPTA